MTQSLVSGSRAALTSSRRADIQGLRAVAILMVMAFHAGLPTPGGFVGVDVFFVISGFVITALLVRELGATGRLDMRRFYRRRVRRLLPALALMIAVTCVLAVPVLWLSAQEMTGTTGVAASLLVANVEVMRVSGDYFAPQAASNALLHTWSLSVEEQFYLAFPAMLLLGWAYLGRWGGGRRAAAGVVALVTAVSFTASVYLSAGEPVPFLSRWLEAAKLDNPHAWAFYSSLTRAWEFGAGALLALAWGLVVAWRRQRMWPWVPGVVQLAGAGLVVASAVFLSGEAGFPGFLALLPVAGAVLLIATGDRPDLPLSRILSSAPMQGIGELSYSLYLWHWPVLVLGSAWLGHGQAGLLASCALVAVSVLPAMASYRWVEMPIRRADSLRGRGLLALVAVCLVVPIAAGVNLRLGGANAWGQEDLRRWEDLRVQSTVDESTAGDDGERGTILLVGDSHAKALAPSVIAAAPAGYRVAADPVNACPFLVRGADWTDGYTISSEECRQRNLQRFRDMAAARPALVIIANRSSAYVQRECPARSVRCPSEEALAEQEQARAQQWGRDLQETLTEVGDAGARILVVSTVPEHEIDIATCATIAGVAPDCVSGPRWYSQQRREAVIATEGATIRESPVAESWDPIDLLCDDRICNREFAGAPIYKDGNHVNAGASALFAPSLRQAIQDALSGGLPVRRADDAPAQRRSG